jgi:Icc protein
MKKLPNSLKDSTLFIVPGNHDARNDGYNLFEEFFGNRFPAYENESVFIQGMDSSSPDTDEGHIGRENYYLIEDMKKHNDKTKIIVLHHHVIPIPRTGREENVLIDSGDVLGHIIDSGINLVLSGHRHLPWRWKLEKTYFVTTGTATSWRLKGRSFPSFNIIDINENLINIKQINILKDIVEEESKLLID